MPIQNMTTLAQLLSRLKDAPIPFAPVPADLGPLSTDTSSAFQALNPEPVPPRFIQPAAPDMDFVSQQTGAPPTAPAPLSRAQRIFNALAGFGAGFQGNGAQFLAQLQEPQREYQQQLERYQGRRTQAIEASERRAEREAEQANRMAEIQYQRDFAKWERASGIRDDAAKERYKQALEAQRQAAVFAAEERRELAREHRARQDDARGIAARLSVGPSAAPPEIAREIAEYQANLRDSLSPAAARWRSAQVRRYEQLVGGASVGGRSASNAALKAVQELESAKGALLALQQRGGSVRDERLVRRRIDRALGRLNAFPGQAQGGVDSQGYPWAKYWNGQQFVGLVADTSAPGPQPQFNPQQPQASPARAQAKAKLMGVGYSDAEAEAELNRLGIQ